jgi:hypothetical protein
MGNKFYIGCVLISIYSFCLVSGQDNKIDHQQTHFFDNLFVTAIARKGFALPEYEYFLYTIDDYVQSVGLTVSRRTTGKNDWEQIYGFPEYGISLFYSTLGNDMVYGREIALYPFFKLHILSRNRFSFDSQIGLGLSYVTKKFDMEENYRNIAVGSHLNIHFNFGLDFNYLLMKKYRLYAGISFDHLSNGNLQEPNIGINSLTSYLGLGYLVGKSYQPPLHPLKPHWKDFDFEFVYYIGGKYTRAYQSIFYFTSSGTVELKYEPFRVLHVGIGADIFYDSSTEREMTVLQLGEYKENYDFRSGIHLSQEIVYNRMSLIIQEGIYLLLTDHVKHNTMYNRGIIRYYITDHIMVNISMKSHLHVLDYPELGFGYRF